MSTKPKPNAKPTKLAKSTETVGKTLKSARLERQYTLKDIELSTRIRGKYLVAIEADDYDALPNNVYTRGFVQTYADFLGLDSAAITKHYAAERGQQSRQHKAARPLAARRFTLTPRLLVLVGSLLLGALAASYLAFQLSVLTAPPKLEVTNPSKDQVLHGSLITVSGHVSGGADAFVNDSPILVDANGRFSTAIALQDGVNSITVSAKNRLGKTSREVRNILAHVPKTDAQNSLPTEPFDGVAVRVQVQDASATVTILIDGKKAFEGTMLPGTTQTFKGSGKVTVSTSNAGATSLTVTNSTAAQKSLGTLGKRGQAKQGFEFDKETQFQ